MERMQKRMREKYGAGKTKVTRKFRAQPRTIYRQPNVYVQPSAGINRRGVISKETGFVDLPSAAYACDTTGSIVQVPIVATGVSVNNRVGKKILWKSIQIRGSCNTNATTTVCDVAILLVYDRRPTGALPAITDILVAANSNAFNNDANSGRFKILRRVDKTLSGNTATPSTGNEVIQVDDYIKLNGLPAVFKAAGTGTMGDVEEGAIYLVTVGSNAAGTTAAVANLAFRTRFVDV